MVDAGERYAQFLPETSDLAIYRSRRFYAITLNPWKTVDIVPTIQNAIPEKDAYIGGLHPAGKAGWVIVTTHEGTYAVTANGDKLGPLVRGIARFGRLSLQSASARRVAARVGAPPSPAGKPSPQLMDK